MQINILKLVFTDMHTAGMEAVGSAIKYRLGVNIKTYAGLLYWNLLTNGTISLNMNKESNRTAQFFFKKSSSHSDRILIASTIPHQTQQWVHNGEAGKEKKYQIVFFGKDPNNGVYGMTQNSEDTALKFQVLRFSPESTDDKLLIFKVLYLIATLE